MINEMLGEGITHAIGYAIKRSKNVNNVAIRQNEFTGRTVNVHLKPTDHFRFNVNTCYVHNVFLDVMLVIFIGLGLIYASVGDYGGACFMLLLALFCVVWLMLIFSMNLVGRKNKDVTYGFNDKGLCLRDEDGFFIIPWRKLVFRKTRKYYFAYFSWCSGFVIPRRDLNVYFEELISEYIRSFQLNRKIRYRRKK